jgi:hypothetical protein
MISDQDATIARNLAARRMGRRESFPRFFGSSEDFNSRGLILPFTLVASVIVAALIWFLADFLMR